jgi:hypothetical protein
MKIHLFSINSTHNEILKSAFDKLVEFKGQFEFVLNTDYSYNIEDKSFNSFKSLFEICDNFREKKKIEKTDVAILISPLSYSGYFSSFEHNSRNIFICTENWQLFSNAEKPLLIAHQVIENILQCLSGFEEKNAHNPSIGCINDMCNNKLDITLKLRTADICPECIQLFLQGGLTNAMLFESMKFLESLRKDFLLQNSYSKKLNPLKLTCIKNNKGNLEIYIGEQLIKFTRTELLIFYVLCMGKEKGNNFNNKLTETKGGETAIKDIKLFQELHKFKNFRDVNTEKYFGVHMFGNISKNVNYINNKLNEALGPNLASFYQIEKKSKDTEKNKKDLKGKLEKLKLQLNKLDKNKQLDQENRAIQRKAIVGSIRKITNNISRQRAKDFPYVIELFTRKDWKDYFDKKGLK